jgi:C4-dicarboxylate-specific signal transduction histidine kinase
MNMSPTKSRSFVIRFGVVLLAALLPLALLVGLEMLAAPPPPSPQASRIANELDRLLQIRLRETFTIAAFPSLRAFAASDAATRAQRATIALNELQAWVAADSPLREAFVVDTQGKVILTTGKSWNQDWSTRNFIKAALAGKLDISPPAHDVNEFSQYYAAPILDNRDNVAGALVARIAAQELWEGVNAASDPTGGSFAVLVDENGVRLADGGDPSQNLVALAPLTAEEQTRVIKEQTYGAQVTLVRTTNLNRAAGLIRSGSLDLLAPRDLGVGALGAQRLTTKPWTVLILAPAPSITQTLSRFYLPLLAALLGAGLATILLTR